MNNSKSFKLSAILPRLRDLPLSNILLPLSLFAMILVGFADISPAQSFGAGYLPAGSAAAANDPERLFALEHRVFDLVNAERSKNGIAPLTWVDQVASVARRHSSSMVEFRFFGHEDLEGRQPEDRAGQFGLGSLRLVAENIAWVSGQDDPAARAVLCWIASTGHRRNIMNPAFRESGIGVAVAADGRVYLTQNFISR